MVNVDKKKVVEMVDKDGYVKIFSEEDIDYSLVYTPYYDQLKAGHAPYGLCFMASMRVVFRSYAGALVNLTNLAAQPNI